jgi:6-pyruvoyltetrahydropterin/6-carboxytetrahydropterin synthase
VTKDYTVFSAGHFITYEGGQCERLHGHNYRVAASLMGELTENGYVFDFVTLKNLLRSICDRLDHRMLLPRENPRLTIREQGASMVVQYQEKSYTFPREDVVLLPIPNTTAEKLGEWIGGELEAALQGRGASNLSRIEVEVEESTGQSASWQKEIPLK